MSTLFGVSLIETAEPVEIAFRSNSGHCKFTTPLAGLLPDETPVIALDNDTQDIKTIGDLKKIILSQV